MSITLRNVAFVSDFQYDFRSSRSTADLLTVVYFNRSGATRPVALDIYGKPLTEFAMLVCFIGVMKIQVKYSALFRLFSVINGFQLFLMGKLHKNIQLMLEFLKAPFLVLHFSYYTLMTFPMMSSITLLSMLMIPLSTLSVIGHLICGKNERF